MRFGVLKSNRKFKRFLMRERPTFQQNSFSFASLLTSRSSFPNCNAESENPIFFLSKKNRIFRNGKRKKLSTCFFTDAQLFYTHFLKSAFEASTFCPFCTVNAAAIFNQSAQDWQAVIRLIL